MKQNLLFRDDLLAPTHRLVYGKIKSDASSVTRSAIVTLGVGYAVLVPLTVVLGWFRFERTKIILGLSDVNLHEYFGSIGIALQASVLGVVLAMTVGVYCVLGEYFIFQKNR